MEPRGTYALPGLHTSRNAVLRYQRQTLIELLQYVWHSSKFYREYYAGHGIGEADLGELTLEDLPIVTKKTLMDHFDAAVTDPRLRKRKLESWLTANRAPHQTFDKNHVVFHTSGTSGDLGFFVYDRIALQIAHTAIARRIPTLQSYSAPKPRVAFYIQSHGHFGSPTMAFQTPRATYETLILSILQPTYEVVGQLNAFQPDRLTGYSSSTAILADLALRGELAIRPKSIWVTADLLTKGLEQKIREAWDVPLYNLYCTSESLYVAVQEPGWDEMTVMDDLNIVEVLGPDHKPVSTGAEGRVIVTNLYNRTLPILRYELGDYVTRGKVHPKTFFSGIRTMRGRVDDALPVVLDNGMPDTLHPITLAEFYVAGLEKVQFVSLHPAGVGIDYVAPHDIDAAVRFEFQRLLDLKGASRTRFEVRRVSSMHNDPQTGKHRLVRRSRAGSALRKAAEQSLEDICAEAQAHESSEVERMLDELEALNDHEAARRLRNLKK